VPDPSATLQRSSLRQLNVFEENAGKIAPHLKSNIKAALRAESKDPMLLADSRVPRGIRFEGGLPPA
jgi:hypothetical protein